MVYAFTGFAVMILFFGCFTSADGQCPVEKTRVIPYADRRKLRIRDKLRALSASQRMSEVGPERRKAMSARMSAIEGDKRNCCTRS